VFGGVANVGKLMIRHERVKRGSKIFGKRAAKFFQINECATQQAGEETAIVSSIRK
jgi:hypothetical protein